ncbi:(Fe-S)-binding protein [Planctomycetota bacterium]
MELLKRPEVSDPGLDEAVKKLTPEQIEATIQKVLTKECAGRLEAYLETCVHCGLCANACHFCISHDYDPTYAPVAKVRNTMWEIVRQKGKVSPEFLKQAARIAFTECNVCRRCSMYCPFGIDMAYMLLTVRRICHLVGLVPQYLQDTVNSHAVTMNQMWVQADDWIDALLWQEEEAADEVKGARIPLDKEGADFMYSVIGPEPKILAQLIGNFTQLARIAKLDWTMPSTDGWDNSNMAMYSGDFETMGRVERLHWDTALKLKVKRIVMGECGHAFRGAVYDGPKWVGWRSTPIPMVHAVEFYHDLIFKEKRVKIVKKFDKPITVQDPCNIVRGRGLGEKLRDLMRATCSDFRDVHPRFEHNYCCAAGGGVINCGPPWTPTRVAGNRTKAEQLKATGAAYVVTPCHNCHSGIEDVIKKHQLGMHTKFFIEILVDVMEIPEDLKA